MKMRSMMVALLALGSLAFAGCHEEEPKTPLEAVVMDASEAGRVDPGSVSGRSPRLAANAPEGIWIGRGTNGEYYLRTTTKNRSHRFQGRIRPVTTEISNFRPTRMDFNDRFKFDGKDIVFDIKTKAEQDGFDFGVAKGGCVEMDFRIDGRSQPEHIYIGEKEAKTPKSHFVLCP
ncbi:Hypothetical protein A7982_07655 [Minicystis rosea]|nr:Hypothetical protein A7982_07655 [Minicystis rosea]